MTEATSRSSAIAEPFRTTKSQRESVPWLNGAGMTQVVIATPRWRVSIAEEPRQSTFSTITGYDRLITPIGTVPIELSGPATEHELADGAARVVHSIQPLTTLRFAGEWAPMCRASAPTRALNVMGKRGQVGTSVQIGPLDTPDPDTVRIYLEISTETAVVVPPGSLHLPTNFEQYATIVIAAEGIWSR